MLVTLQKKPTFPISSADPEKPRQGYLPQSAESPQLHSPAPLILIPLI